MEIELTEEQLEKIANMVNQNRQAEIERNKKPSPARWTKTVVCFGPRPAANVRDMNLLLTVRSDLNTIVSAMRIGKWDHAYRLAAELLNHVDETVEEA